jgi:hypothetical protein
VANNEYEQECFNFEAAEDEGLYVSFGGAGISALWYTASTFQGALDLTETNALLVPTLLECTACYQQAVGRLCYLLLYRGRVGLKAKY